VPRPSAVGESPAPLEPAPAPAPAFVTYLPLPPATPPTDTSELEEAHLPPPAEAAPPAPEIAPTAPPSPVVAETPAAPPPDRKQRPPKPPKPPRPPKAPREPLSGGLIIAIAATVLLLAGGGIAALVLGGDDKPKPVAAATAAPQDTATPEATKAGKRPDLARQVQSLDALMKTSEKGRAAAAKGDTKAAIANRAQLLKDVQALRAKAADKQLKAGLGSFAAAVRESLRQNRECGAGCSASDLNKVGRLKQQTVGALNPLLRKYAKTSYRARDI
jgi:hypothetical protein